MINNRRLYRAYASYKIWTTMLPGTIRAGLGKDNPLSKVPYTILRLFRRYTPEESRGDHRLYQEICREIQIRDRQRPR